VRLWQVSQGAFVATCFAGLPVAIAPLWHLVQPATSPVWFMRAPAKVTVLLWQVSHGALVTTWFGRFPIAATPLWQAAQPLMSPAWLGFVDPSGMPDDVRAPGGFDEPAFGGAVVAAVAAGVVVVAVPAGVVAFVPAGAGVVAAVVAGALGGSVGTIPPLNVTVLKWQVLQAAFVMMWLGVLPVAVLLLWQFAQGPSAWT